MKKYITMFLGYGIVFHIFIGIVGAILSFIWGFLLLIIGGIGIAIGATMIDFSNFTLSNMSVISIIFNLIILIFVYATFFISLKIISDRAFKENVKTGYFTKKTINMDIIYSTIFVAIFPIIYSIIHIINDGNYYSIIGSLIYIISFFIVSKMKAKKEFKLSSIFNIFNKIIILLSILLLSGLLLYSIFGKKTEEQKILENFENDIEAIKDDLYDTPIGSDEFTEKSGNVQNDIDSAMKKTMDEIQINQLIEDGDDLTIPRDIMYNISIFDETKDTSSIEKQLIEKGYRIGEKENIAGMIMFYVYKKHPVDMEIIAKDEEELNSITSADWLSYDGWVTEVAKTK